MKDNLLFSLFSSKPGLIGQFFKGDNKYRLKWSVKIMTMCILITIYAGGWNALFAQGIVSVDHFKGRAQVSIPIWEFKSGSISVPISLDYTASGIKAEHNSGSYGLGWSLTAGGSVSRTLNDLPDDMLNKGWLYGNSAALVESFNIANDGNSSTCTDETSDINYISTNFTASKDAEPDIFSVDGPGISCKIVFDKNHNPKIIPYKDYKVTFTTDMYGIDSFTITNDQGMVYTYTGGNLDYQKGAGGGNYYNRDWDVYGYGVYYRSSWNLTKMTDVMGNYLSFAYTTSIMPGTNGETPESVSKTTFIERNPAGGFNEVIARSITTKMQPTIISSITDNFYKSVQFNYLDGEPGGRKFLKSISLPEDGRTINVSYRQGSDRILQSIGEEGCDVLPPYQFSYKGMDAGQGNVFSGNYLKQQDIWGYYNPSLDTVLTPKIYVYPYNASTPNLERYRFNPAIGYSGSYFIIPGTDRQANPNTVMTGTLNKIVYPTGGNTFIEYESNNYFDKSAQTVYNGGGIRVKTITESDGIDPTKNMVTEYSYNDPNTTLSSGKPITLPSLAFTKAVSGGTPGTQLYWELSTVRSKDDLSTTSTDIVYGFVTVKQSGLGKTVYEYSTPGTFWDQTAPSWSPTMGYTARTSCVSAGDLINARNTYPYAPNPEYDFERGLLKSVKVYNEGNAILSKDEYTYQRTNQPEIVYGLRFSNMSGAKAYAKYGILTSCAELDSTKKSTIYDLNDATKSSETLSNSFYTSSLHKSITKTTVANSDGTIKNTYFKYVKDYSSAVNGDAATSALLALKTGNSNTLVESYSSIVKPGETEKYISGSLTRFQSLLMSNSSTVYAPAQILKFVSNEGATAFQPSQVVSGTTFQQDVKYIPAITYESYSNRSGLPLTVVSNNNRSIKSYLFRTNFDLPMASILNAKSNEVGYLNFEGNEDLEDPFVSQNISFVNDAHTGRYSASVSPTSYIQKTFKKGNCKNYVFSCWLKPGVTGALTLTLTNTSSLARTYSLPYSISSTWKYYELKVPVTEMTADFTLKVQPGTQVYIDDALFYPDNAEVNTFSYDSGKRKLSETNSNGITVYYEYDKIGRLKYVRDQDQNIVRKESYVAYNITPGLSTPSFTYDLTKTKDGVSIPFSIGASNACLTSVTYNWNFGDGTAVVTNSTAPSHTYANAGTYTVTVTAVHPLYGTKTYSEAITITTNALQVQVCGSGVIAVDNCHIEAPSISTCAGFPSDGTHTYFNVSSISGCPVGATYTYLWETSSDNGATWTSVGTGTSFTLMINPRNNQDSYWVRCTINSSCGRSGTSNVATFTGYYSTPDCPQR